MSEPCVLEYVRYANSVWNLPAEHVAALARAFPQVRVVRADSREEADARLPEADVVFGYAVTEANFARARRLRWIHSPAAGVGHMLFPALVASGVTLTNARGLHADAMAEHTLGVLLAFARKLHWSRDAQRERRWDQVAQWTEPPFFESLAGSTLGLVGFGRVGTAIAARARALGMRVLAVRRHPAADPAPADAQWGVERLPELLAAADWLVLATPLTADTHGLVGEAELARMKPGARLVNLGRGGLVDEAALAAALAAGRLAGAALDVFATEPLPAESPLWDQREVIVTPHTSGVGPRYWERALAQFSDNLRRYLAGEPLANVVDKRAGY
ncbi:MAG TPA: D-2-hydroxyacid dehydrogenase [Candidatus Eisenbacteria bacterium]|nr:D-2-hydroxyacid dehydrogenase [Candidatus Eisenbacteria bacterium]